MNEMKATEVRAMSVEQLNEKLTSLKKDLFFLRMQHATNQLDNPLTVSYTHLGGFRRDGQGFNRDRQNGGYNRGPRPEGGFRKPAEKKEGGAQ